jgi:hypothetical protein
LFDLALGQGMFTQKGAWVYLDGENFAQGRDNAVEKLKSREDLIIKIKSNLEVKSPNL